MSCCNPLFGNGAPTNVLAPVASQLPFYVDLLNNHLYFWNGTAWVSMNASVTANTSVTYNPITGALLVNGNQTGTIPSAGIGTSGTIKLGANSAIKANGAGELVIDCAVLAAQCGASGSTGTTASPTAPASPTNGMLWTNNSAGTISGIGAGMTAYWSGSAWLPIINQGAFVLAPPAGTPAGAVPTANGSGGWAWAVPTVNTVNTINTDIDLP